MTTPFTPPPRTATMRGFDISRNEHRATKQDAIFLQLLKKISCSNGQLLNRKDKVLPKCSKCNKLTHRHGYCNECQKQYREENYDYERERIRKLKQKYGPLAAEEYLRLSKLQDGLCAACGLPEGRGIGGRRTTRERQVIPLLVIDHDHGTGQIRALLCNACNQAHCSSQIEQEEA